MRRGHFGAVLGLVALLSACGGGSSGGGGTVTVTPGSGGIPTPSGTATPTPTAPCALRDRQSWAGNVLREWYLFPETLPAIIDPAPYDGVDAYIDALTATARSQGRDRYFTYLASIASEDAYYANGTTAGFGFRLAVSAALGRVFITEAFEGAPALAAGIDRGAEIVAIGATSATLRSVSTILAAEGSAGVTNALGPDTVGTTRAFRITDTLGTRDVTIIKGEFDLPAVSPRYGSLIIDDNGKKVGYLNLRTFIAPANDALRAAFAQFRGAGVSEVIIDLRYNGGGLVSVAGTLADLLGRNRGPSDVVSYLAFRPEKSAENETRYFRSEANAIAPAKVAFIGTRSTASASELVINTFAPFLGANMALVGGDTYGKPVGQIAIDRPECDDRLRVIAFAVQNSARSAAYFNGLASTLSRSCQAADDIAYPLGDPREASVRAALDFLGGRSCAPIGSAALARAARETQTEALVPERPTTAQRDMPGSY